MRFLLDLPPPPNPVGTMENEGGLASGSPVADPNASCHAGGDCLTGGVNSGFSFVGTPQVRWVR